MNSRRVLGPVTACLAALCAAAPAASSLARAPRSGNSFLVAAPYEGHPGDPIYLTGWGLQPNHEEIITVACPSWAQAFAGGASNYSVITGPTTDKHGNFRNFRITAPDIHGQSGCQIYADDRSNQFGPDIPATYSILPMGQKLDRCARTICVTMNVTSARSHARRAQAIVLHARTGEWPGAHVSVSLLVPPRTPIHYTSTLNLHGSATITVPPNPGISSPSPVTIRALLHLGPYSGSATTRATLVHPAAASPAP